MSSYCFSLPVYPSFDTVSLHISKAVIHGRRPPARVSLQFADIKRNRFANYVPQSPRGLCGT